jgi:hypothetical protein
MDFFTDMSNSAYHAHTAVSRSMLMELRDKSPQHYHYKYLSGKYEKPEPPDIITPVSALGFGNAAHTYILERHKFDDEYYEWSGQSRATKAGKAAWAECLEIANGRQLIHSEALDKLFEMRKAVESHELAKTLLLSESAQVECSLFYTDEITGINLKSRPDIILHDAVIDLKTVATAKMGKFQKEAYDYGYHLQAAMQYLAMEKVLDKQVTDFLYVAIEKEPPYAINVYRLDEAYLELGFRELKELLAELKKCTESGVWTGYQPGTITPPLYAVNKIYN